MIREVRINNLRSISHLYWEFPEGLILIKGLNGAGKSTFVEAILYALFGPDALRTPKTFASTGNAEVTVSGKFHTPFEVLRTFGGVTSLKTTVTISSTKEINAWFRRLVDLKTFCQTYVSQQTEINNIARARPYERKKILSELLGFGLIEDCVSAVKVPKIVGADGVSTLPEKRATLEEIEKLTQGITIQEVMRVQSLWQELEQIITAEKQRITVADLEQNLPDARENLSKLQYRKSLLETALQRKGQPAKDEIISCPLCGHDVTEHTRMQWQRELVDNLNPTITELLQIVRTAESAVSAIPRGLRKEESVRSDIQKYGDIPPTETAEALSLLSRLKAEVSMLERLQKEVETSMKLEKVKSLFVGFRDWMISHNLQLLSEMVSYYLSSYTKWSQFIINEDYSIYVNDRPIETYSEGEKNICCTVFRFAITKLLSEQFFGFTPFLILDSSFDAVDEPNFRNAISLAHMCAGEFSQIIVTTHHDIEVPEAAVFVL
jgi:DNA repair exonuclease SbcCD ATPase subunit